MGRQCSELGGAAAASVGKRAQCRFAALVEGTRGVVDGSTWTAPLDRAKPAPPQICEAAATGEVMTAEPSGSVIIWGVGERKLRAMHVTKEQGGVPCHNGGAPRLLCRFSASGALA